MTMNPFPPQAYTRETLVKAYQWLQNQNDHIKALATTPDLLISLYMKTKNSGEDFLERPSLKTFKSELKNLAGMMGEFETEPTTAALAAEPVSQQPTSSANIHVSLSPAAAAPANPPPTAAAPTRPSTIANPTASQAATSAVTPGLNFQSAVSAPQDPISPGFQLDPRSLGILQEVKATLNLSSDQEALRLLISMGHNRLKNL